MRMKRTSKTWTKFIANISWLRKPNAMSDLTVTNCYLCGKPLTGEKQLVNKDHVPPTQLMAKSLKQKYRSIQLETLPTHRSCNSSFSMDEEYFKHCLVPFARGSEAGDAIFNKTIEEYWSGKNVKLVDRVRGQAKDNVKGILLPPGKFRLDYDQVRIERVVRKIIKGLHFLETQECLDAPDDIKMIITFPGQQPPDDFFEITRSLPMESRGHYQGVFAYRPYVVEDLHYWALLFWDRIIITASFQTRPNT